MERQKAFINMEKMNICKSRKRSIKIPKALVVFLAALLILIACEIDSNGPDNNGDANLPAVITSEVTSVTGNTAVCGGTVTEDGGSDVTSRGVCWSTSPSPSTSDDITIDGSGTGEFTSAITGLTPSTPYYVRAYATNSEGTAYGNARTFVTSDDSTIVIDIDGNVYQTVRIGTQVWMKENLKVTHYNNGDPIPNVTTNSVWDTLLTGAYCAYDNDPSNVAVYGMLYNWYAVDESRVLAPTGWHVPTDDEWKTLEIYLGMDPGIADTVLGYRGDNEGSMLAGRADLWLDNVLENDPEFGTSGFTALPGGYRSSIGTFGTINCNAFFWSSSEYSASNAWRRVLVYYYTNVNRKNYDKESGYSVRCVRDY